MNHTADVVGDGDGLWKIQERDGWVAGGRWQVAGGRWQYCAVRVTTAVPTLGTAEKVDCTRMIMVWTSRVAAWRCWWKKSYVEYDENNQGPGPGQPGWDLNAQEI